MTVEETGAMTGTGNKVSKENEIPTDVLAAIRNFIVGYNNSSEGAVGGVLSTGGGFQCGISLDNKNQIKISSGICMAYGYFGFAEEKTFDILPPAVTQYYLVYAELNLSELPNSATIKIKNNQGSKRSDPSCFRQDNLNSMKVGIFQVPLWRITVTNEGIRNEDDLKDLRVVRTGIEHVHHTYECHEVVRELFDNVMTEYTIEESNASELVANTAFVDKEVHSAAKMYIEVV